LIVHMWMDGWMDENMMHNYTYDPSIFVVSFMCMDVKHPLFLFYF
jgi:hypothetical protein